MNISDLKILLIEDNNGDAELIQRMLATFEGNCSLKRSDQLSTGLKLLEDETFDVVLLDLGLPDSCGIDTLQKIQQKKQAMPVIVLTGLSDEKLSAEAISSGAQDYLVKGKIDSEVLYRTIRYSIKRKQAEETIRKAKELSDALNSLGNVIYSTLDIEIIMKKVVVEAAQAIGADGSSIGLFQGDSIVITYMYNMPRDFSGQHLSPDEAKDIHYAASVRDAVVFNSATPDDRINVYFWDHFGIRSMLAAPLIIRDKVIGVICFYCFSSAFSFTEIYVDFVRKLSKAISVALENVGLYEDRRRMEEKISHLAHHDELTGLPNRRLFASLLTLELAQSRRYKQKMAIFFLDLDQFKDINDTLGHAAGDELLKDVADRLKSTIRESDTVARIGGDEFNIMLPNIGHVEDIADIARKIVECFQKPFMIAGHELHMTTSIGISIYPDDGAGIDALLRNADIAMYHAKKEGRNTYQFYNPEINVRSVERIRLDNWLRNSIKRGELSVYYQPQVDIKTGKIVCAEALVRWRHPGMGLLDAAQFIPLAEETGFVTVIDEWVLQTVCAQARSWQDAGLTTGCLTVNMSARLLQSTELVDKVSRILGETEVLPDFIHLEITESMAMKNIGRTAARLKELSDMGIRIYIDDFGIGYSSLNYLKRLPIDCLKIDKSFIQDIAIDSDDRAIISAVTAMAHKMKIKVIAEGVETEEQLSFLRLAGCDEMQGFLYSRALPAEEFEELITAGK